MAAIFTLIYIAIGAAGHFWITSEETFRKRWPIFDFVACLGWGFGFLWFVFVLTWPIWGIILAAVWVNGRDEND